MCLPDALNKLIHLAPDHGMDCVLDMMFVDPIVILFCVCVFYEMDIDIVGFILNFIEYETIAFLR